MSTQRIAVAFFAALSVACGPAEPTGASLVGAWRGSAEQVDIASNPCSRLGFPPPSRELSVNIELSSEDGSRLRVQQGSSSERIVALYSESSEEGSFRFVEQRETTCGGASCYDWYAIASGMLCRLDPDHLLLSQREDRWNVVNGQQGQAEWTALLVRDE